jgi:hypothetical protein
VSVCHLNCLQIAYLGTVTAENTFAQIQVKLVQIVPAVLIDSFADLYALFRADLFTDPAAIADYLALFKVKLELRCPPAVFRNYYFFLWIDNCP